jgi:hypothetical protein
MLPSIASSKRLALANCGGGEGVVHDGIPIGREAQSKS